MSAIADLLVTARRAQGFTQAELADRAGVTQAALSRYEGGLREPSEDVVQRLAEVLRVTPQLLLTVDRCRGAMAVDAHMRRRKTAKATVWRQLEARLNMYRLHLNRLFDVVALKADQNLPTFDPIETAPEDAARLVRMQWKMPVGPVASLTGWIESAGCVVVEEDFRTARVDGLSQWVDDHPVMLINRQSPTDRTRLTLAHELAHLCLHSLDVTETVEQDANAFAAEFLMPAEMIRPQLRNITLGRLHDLKREWGVSMQALIERAHSLRLLRPTQRTYLYKQLSMKGWRTTEPVSDELPPERPALPAEIGKAMSAAGLSDDEIAAMAGFADPADNPFRWSPRRLHAV